MPAAENSAVQHDSGDIQRLGNLHSHIMCKHTFCLFTLWGIVLLYCIRSFVPLGTLTVHSCLLLFIIDGAFPAAPEYNSGSDVYFVIVIHF